MITDTNALASLIGSRICHDLISPIGAVNNGIELLELSGTASSPELALVTESVAHANARIRFFRLAFGAASQEQETGAEEVNGILKDLRTDDRTKVSDFPAGYFPRAEVRAVLLALLCTEQAVPFGGQITIETASHGWTILAEADRLNADADLWNLLTGACPENLPAPAYVQFLMLPGAAREAGLECNAKVGERTAAVTLRRA